jgi:macrophage erythroblast attacher
MQLSELQETAGKPTLDVTRERLQHLTAVEALQTTASLDFSRWADTRLDRWLVDWALRSGREKTARKLAHDKNMEVCCYR